MAGKEIEFWYAEKDSPGYDTYGRDTLEERMTMGGHTIKARTGLDGKAHVSLPHLDKVEDSHYSYQFVAQFNVDRSDTKCKPAQSLEHNSYALWSLDPPLE